MEPRTSRSDSKLLFYSSSMAQRRVIALLSNQEKNRGPLSEGMSGATSVLGLFTSVANAAGFGFKHRTKDSEEEDSALSVSICNLSNHNVYILNIDIPDNAENIKPKNTFFPLSQGESGTIDLSIRGGLKNDEKFELPLIVFDGEHYPNHYKLVFTSISYGNGHAIIPKKIHTIVYEEDDHEHPTKTLEGEFNENKEKPIQLEMAEIKKSERFSRFFNLGIGILPGFVTKAEEQQNNDSSLNIFFINGDN